MQPNIFGSLENCIKPSKNDFKINSTYEKNLFLVATDINVKCWATGTAMEFLYFSCETTLKDEITKAFVPFPSAQTDNSDKTNTNITLNNIENTLFELGVSSCSKIKLKVARIQLHMRI